MAFSDATSPARAAGAPALPEPPAPPPSAVIAQKIVEGSQIAATLFLAAVVGALALNVASRLSGFAVPAAAPLAPWAFTALAFAALPGIAVPPGGWRGFAGAVIGGFAIATLGLGLAGAAAKIGGAEQGLGIPQGARFALAAAFAALALCAAAVSGRAAAAATILGISLALVPLPPLSLWVGAAVFCIALAVKLPVTTALVAGVAVSPGPLHDPALAQTFVRGLSPYPLLAVPLFILAAALMVEGGVGARIVTAARWFARGRRSALGEANVIASLLFGGVSGSSIADAALNARLLVPGMIAAGYRPGFAVGITASGAILPNVVPPSIALLLASSAVNLSVDALWLAGLGAGVVLALSLWVAVRLIAPPAAAAAPDTPPIDGRAALFGLAAPLTIGLGILGALRAGIVTAVEGGLVAVLLAALFAAPRGVRALAAALSAAAVQTGRVALLIAAAAPVGYLFAISGVKLETMLPMESGSLALLAAILAAMVIGTALDVGAAILVFLPILVPPLVLAGVDPVHATVTLTVALLLGGLTPPVAILVLVVEDVSGVQGSFWGTLPFLCALLVGLLLIAAVPAFTSGLAAAL